MHRSNWPDILLSHPLKKSLQVFFVLEFDLDLILSTRALYLNLGSEG